MSRTRAQALRPLIDARVADYIDAAIAAALADEEGQRKVSDELLATYCNEHEAMLAAHAEQLKLHSDALDKARYEERFALTKAKMLRAFKEMGIK